jgi:hypothetical protein
MCTEHPDKSRGHDGCQAVGVTCSRCNASPQTAGGLMGSSGRQVRPPPPRDAGSGRFVPRHIDNGEPLADSFDYQTLWKLLARIAERHRLIRFADLIDREPDGRYCILRHDVDYTLYAALFLAREEAARGIHATYFLLVNSRYYNLLSPSHAHVPATLAELGHEVGLHYDVEFLQQFPVERWPELLTAQAVLLERLSGQRVRSIAMHQPGLHGVDPFRNTSDFLNAYSDRFTREMPYLSDSCRAWRNDAWQMLHEGPLPDRLQLSLHPINWAQTDRDRLDIFRDLHLDLADAVIREGDDLLSKIAVHSGVVEHNRRTAR